MNDPAPLPEGPLPPEVGELGESLEAHERARIASLAAARPERAAPTALKPLLPAASERAAIAEVARLMLREMRHDVQAELASLADDVKAQTRLLKHIDVPLEQVADSHERATHSFETLRAEFLEVSQKVAFIHSILETHSQLLAEINEQIHALRGHS